MNKTSAPPAEIDHGHSPWAGERASKNQVRVHTNRPYGLGPAIRAFQNGEPIIYAMSLPDGTVKIGCTTDLARRRSQLDGELLGFMFGDMDDEKAIHDSLAAHVRYGREYYERVPSVMSFVNAMRARMHLDPLQD